MMRARILLVAAALLSTTAAEARITRLVVTGDAPAYGGRSFGEIGAYRHLSGTAYGEVDPADPHNAIITDLAEAQKLPNGKVGYAMPFYIVAPIDPTKGNRTLWFDVVNRGGPQAGGALNFDAKGTIASADAGDGFMQRQGWVLAAAGWEGDIDPAAGMAITLPLAKGVSGIAHGSWEPMFAAPAQTLPYPARDGAKAKAVLQTRVLAADAPVTVPAGDWAFGDCRSTPFPGTPSAASICLKGGFDTNHIYDLYYESADPPVMGLGFAAVRDFVAFLRQAKADDAGTPNPLLGRIDHTLAYGASQSGRYLRSFVHLGFNADEQGAKVFDGISALIASLHISLNIRFAQPTLIGLQHEESLFPIADGALSFAVRTDEVSGATTGLLGRCAASNSCPKIFQIVTNTEYWQYRASLSTTDARGRDLSLPDGVRIYHLAGSSHAPGISIPACNAKGNPTGYREATRALALHLQRWVADGRAPPSSRYASNADGTLAEANAIGWPAVPGITFAGTHNGLVRVDRGAQFVAADESGIMAPPRVIAGATYRVLLPKVDADGNELGGYPLPARRAPLGTYTGWSLRKAGFGEGDLCSLQGSFVPFARTEAERGAAQDPRPSLEARYGTEEGYQCALQRAVAAAQQDGMLLEEDVSRIRLTSGLGSNADATPAARAIAQQRCAAADPARR